MAVAAAARLSPACVGAMALVDAYLCLLHLTLGVVAEPLFGCFAAAAFVEFLGFAVLELRVLGAAARAARPPPADTWAAQRDASRLYAGFYASLLATIFAVHLLRRWGFGWVG